MGGKAGQGGPRPKALQSTVVDHLSADRYLGPLIEDPNRFVRRPQTVRHVSKINERCEIAVSFGNLWSGDSVTNNGNLETQLQKLPQMRFDTHVGKHASENDLIDPLLSELER